jgi:membrane-bound metal-dependent hydrolase YbcI (DUF457 family)
MKIPEHIALSYLLAQCGVQQHYGPADTALMIAAGCLPDLDGLTILGGWRLHRLYHRVLGHGLPLTLLGPALLAAFAALVLRLDAWPYLWGWLQLALLCHLVTDFCFYRWPVQLLWPFSSRGLGFGWVSWNDLVPTALLYAASAVALCWPLYAPAAAATGLSLLGVYLAWRAWQPRPQSGWKAWLTGSWAPRAAPFWRWLTGDFIT